MGLPGRERSLTISSAVWIQYTNVPDGQTDGHRATRKDLNVLPGAAHALIGVKVNSQVYSMQQLMSAKFHPDRSTFWRMTLEKPVFGL